MKKKLLNLVFICVACVNAVVFYTFSNAQNACSNQGTGTISGHIKVSLPTSFPVTNYQTSNSNGYDYFHWVEMEQYQNWFVRIRVVYGDNDTPLMNNKYGYLHSASSAIWEYPSGSCATTNSIVTGTCPYFPIRLRSDVNNTIFVNLVSPVRSSGLRYQANFTKTVKISSDGFIQTIRQNWENTSYTSLAVIADPC